MTRQTFASRLRCTRLLACAAIIGGITGCTTHDDDRSGGAPPVASITAMTDSKNLQLPLDRYMFSLKDYRLLSDAHGSLLHRCMQRFGVSYPVRRFQEGGIKTRNQRRYGITDPAEARRHGYRVPGTDNKPTPRSAQDADPKVAALLTGEGATGIKGRPVQSGGCVGEAQRFLTGGAAALEDIAEPMAMKSWDQSSADHRVQEVFARWSECMKRAGFSYRTPLESSRDRDLVRELSPLQIKTAVTDASCKQEHNVIGTWAAVEAAYQEIMIRENKPALELLRKANRARLQRAATVVPAALDR